MANAQGFYELKGLATGFYTLSASSKGQGHARREHVRLGDQPELFLVGGKGGFHGNVVAQNGKPVRGAVVLLESVETSRDRSAAREFPLVVTDARGQFELAGVDTGTYRFLVRHPRFACELVDGIVAKEGLDAVVNVELSPPVGLSGRVVDMEGRPLAARIAIQRLDGSLIPATPTMNAIFRTEARADGRFRMDSLPPGTVTLTAAAPGFETRTIELDARPNGNVIDLGDVVLEVGLAIRGGVRDRAGTPVAQARVVASLRSPSLGGDVSHGEDRTRTDGTFVVGGLSNGMHTLRVTADGYVPTPLQEVEAGTSGIDVILDSGGAITGIAVDETGQPVTTYTVSADPVDGTGLGASQAIVVDDGRFLLGGLSPGAYALTFIAPAGAAAVRRTGRIALGVTTDIGPVTLRRGGGIRGLVVDRQEAPVPGAVVTAIEGTRIRPTGNEPQATTDMSGRFEVHGLAAGTASLLVRHSQYADARLRGVDVAPGEASHEIRVVVSQGARIEGRVLGRDGIRPTQGAVEVWAASLDQPEGPLREMLVPADGSFEVDHLPPGSAVVRYIQEPSARYDSAMAQVVSLREGETTAVEFRVSPVRVTGRVMSGSGPAAGLRLAFRGVMAGPVQSGGAFAVTGQDGTYEVLLQAAGRYRVVAEGSGAAARSSLGEVDIPESESWTKDFVIGGASVSGIVVDAETDQPIASAQIVARAQDPTLNHVASSDAEGRFQMELPDGSYHIAARAENYQEAVLEVTTVASREESVRLALTHGAAIRGRVFDTNGRPLEEVPVIARSNVANSTPAAAVTRADGSFRIAGLNGSTVYNLLAGTGNPGYAFRAGIAADAEEVSLVLEPAATIRLMALTADNVPVSGASARLDRVGDELVTSISRALTDATGATELLVPLRPVEIVVSKNSLEGRIRLVATRHVAEATVTLVTGRE